MTSFGVRKPCRLRGWLLRMSATRLRSSAVWTDRSLPLGKYWHSISSPRSRSTILYGPDRIRGRRRYRGISPRSRASSPYLRNQTCMRAAQSRLLPPAAPPAQPPRRTDYRRGRHGRHGSRSGRGERARRSERAPPRGRPGDDHGLADDIARRDRALHRVVLVVVDVVVAGVVGLSAVVTHDP